MGSCFWRLSRTQQYDLCDRQRSPFNGSRGECVCDGMAFGLPIERYSSQNQERHPLLIPQS
jgi:hypothetical protein